MAEPTPADLQAMRNISAEEEVRGWPLSVEAGAQVIAEAHAAERTAVRELLAGIRQPMFWPAKRVALEGLAARVEALMKGDK